ncbi:AraC-like ligand-binding domain-containing protein [Rhizobium alvei]|uniref:Helix-turn-helix domain-containing protein n=1 Tax=Rhizobium alvei TaxID=1132659 RepID=A0ABT8YTD2_9HYPH|nr:helix-turn-helix domain-containing protein [Rhizobium alvei]MDO6966861.1 helix-turn-helix domain-containing protein [Rhizobium alvei]
MKSIITTEETPRHDRSRHWHEAIASAYFPLDLTFRNTDNFAGDLMIWTLGDVSLSRLASESLQYRRLPKHMKAERDEHFLVTVPIRSQVNFSQCGKEVQCQPGGFFLERSHEPYEFWHDDFADLWVMKVESSELAAEIRQPDRFCSMQFNATEGAGGLFTDMLQHIPARFDAMSEEVRRAVGKQLVDLLVLSLKADERTLTAGSSSVRTAHLTRIEAFVRRNLHNAELDPETVARACGLSVRYLHELFRDTNQTLGSWVRDQRLMACRSALADPSNRQTVAEIAYRFGFSDHAQFSRAFKAHYSITPKEFRDQTRARMRTAN